MNARMCVRTCVHMRVCINKEHYKVIGTRKQYLNFCVCSSQHERPSVLCLQVNASCLEGSIRDPWGRALPACMIMERGEALDLWMDRAQPDKYMAFSVRSPPLSSPPPSASCVMSVLRMYHCVYLLHYSFSSTQDSDALCAGSMQELTNDIT